MLNSLLTDESRPAAAWLDRSAWRTRCGFVVCSDKQGLSADSAPVYLETSPQDNRTLPLNLRVSTAFTKPLATFLHDRPIQDWPVGSAQLDDSLFPNRSDMIAVKQIYALLPGQGLELSLPIKVLKDHYRLGTDTSNGKGLSLLQIAQNPLTECTEEEIQKLQRPSSPTVFPINCFHWIVSFKDSHGNITVKTDRQILDSKPGPSFDARWNVAVLLGFHVMVADKPGWTWSTFWWSMAPARSSPTGPYAERAEQIPWNRYTLATTALDNPNSGEPIANPYLEAAKGDAKTNCIFCHSRARYPQTAFNGGRTPMPSTKPLLPCYQIKDRPASPDGMSPAEGCSGSTITHFLWSVADRKQFSVHAAAQ